MSWQRIAMKTMVRCPDTVRFTFRQDKGKERVHVRIGWQCLAAVKWKLGDRVEILWDDERCLLGLRKADDGRTLTGKNRSATLIFPRLNGAVGKAIVSMVNREIHAQVEKGMLVIDCREVVK